MNIHDLTMSKLTMLLSLILLHAGINQQPAAAQDQDWVKCFPDRTSHLTVINVKSIVASNVFKALYQPPKEAKLYFFNSLMLQSTRLITNRITFLYPSPVFTFEGNFDQDKIIKDIVAYGNNNQLVVTEEIFEKYKIIRVGNEVYCVLKKSLIIYCSSPPPDAKGGGGLFAETPGRAENNVKDAISRIKNKETPRKDSDFAALLPKLKLDKPIVSISMDNKKQKHLAYVEIRENEIYYKMQIDDDELQAAIDTEKEEIIRYREYSKEFENLPISNFIKDAKINRVDKTVTMELLIPVDELKKASVITPGPVDSLLIFLFG